MVPERRTVVLFLVLWLTLAILQFTRSAQICYDGSTGSQIAWGLQLLMLGAPLLAVRRPGNPPGSERRMSGDLALVLLAYVPVTLALRLVETCGDRW